MKTLLLIGLFANRHQTLIRALGQRFRLISFERESAEWPGGLEALPLEPDFEAEFSALEKALAASLGGGGLSASERDDVRVAAEEASRKTILLGRLTSSGPIDAVLSSADYSSHPRPVVLEARRLGIPTICVEHGLFAMHPEAWVWREGTRLNFYNYVSDVVIVDSVLERRLIEGFHEAEGRRPAFSIQVLGTPLDAAPDVAGSRAESRAALGLEPDVFTVCVATSWRDPVLPSISARLQLEELEFYKRTFAALARQRTVAPLQVVVKTHPTFSLSGILTDAEAYLLELGEAHGISSVVVSEYTAEASGRVLNSADLILCPAGSSLLWDALLKGIPAAVSQPESLIRALFHPHLLNVSAAPFRYGCARYVSEAADFDKVIAAARDPAWRADFEIRRGALLREYSISPESSVDKSERICNWLFDFI